MQKRKAADKLALFSTMNEDQLAARFDNYEPDPAYPSQEEALDKAQKLVKTIIARKEKPVGILFAGSMGLGKSHISAAACHAMAAEGRSAAFITISQLKRKLTSTFNNGSKVTADEIMDYLRSVDLLVIDDIGQHAQSEFVDETLFDLLESRQGKANIFTTNLDGRSLIDALGRRIYERVKYNSHPHKIDGSESRRKFNMDPAWDF
jgi:DNA replication protein DnaC